MSIFRNRILKKLFVIFIFFVIITFLFIFIDLYSFRYTKPDIKIPEDKLHDYTGLIHIHTKYSDGSGTPEEIARIAHNLGIDFILISDHNTIQSLIDGKEGYSNNVLVMIGNEISSEIGHYLVYSPSLDFKYSDFSNLLSRFKENKLQDFYAVFCHPFHPKTPIKDWNYYGFDALEIFNGDSQWRDDSLFEIFEVLVGSIIYKNPLNKLVDRPEKDIKKWCELFKSRKIFQIGSVDAHSNIKIFSNFAIKFPGYDATLRFVKTHIVTEERLSGFIKEDKYIIFDCLKKGRCYTELGNFSDPSGFMFRGISDYDTVYSGEEIKGETMFSIIVPDTADIIIKLYNNDEIVCSSENYKLEYTTAKQGEYWVEVIQVRKRLPFFQKNEISWIISNPIFLLKN